jgi:hypothetical protein
MLETLCDVISYYCDTHATDLDVLEYFGYRCAHCNVLLPVWGSVAGKRSPHHGHRDQLLVFSHLHEVGRLYWGFHWDHIAPADPAQRWNADWRNLVPSCHACNERKSNRDPIQWLAGLPAPRTRPEPAPARRSVWDLPPTD